MKMNIENSDKIDILLNHGLVSYLVLTMEGEIIELNADFAKLTGYEIQDLVHASINKLLKEDIRSEFFRILEINQNNDSNFTLIISLRKKDGSEIMGQFKGKSIHPTGSPKALYYFIFNDIQQNEDLSTQNANLKLKDELLANQEIELNRQNTKLQKLSAELQEQFKTIDNLHDRIIENEMRLKLSFSSVNDGIWDWNIKTGTVSFSDRFFTMLGYDPFDFPNTMESWKELLHPDDTPMTTKLFDDVSTGMLNEFSIEYRMRTKEGPYLWILSRGKLIHNDENGISMRFLGTHVDITDRKSVV
jgi:PAS domain S-box-containing protein